MMPDIDAGVRQLTECVKKIESLLTWRTLCDGKSSDGVSFRFDSHADEDIRVEVGMFWSLNVSIRDALTDLDHEERARFMGKVRELERRLAALQIDGFK